MAVGPGVAVGAEVGVRVGATVGPGVGAGEGAGLGRKVSHFLVQGEQILLAQSPFCTHFKPGMQPGQPDIAPPPQSTSVSAPPFLLSPQVTCVCMEVGEAVGDAVGRCVGFSVGEREGC